MEIERKYLVDKLPDSLAQYPCTEIEQGYLCIRPTVRVRRAGDSFWLTIKEKIHTDSTAIHNREEEFSLDADAYARLRAKCEGVIVSKTRYRIPVGGLTAELDIFHKPHEGLQLVEVEFPDTASADAFVNPDWFGDDVSLDLHYSNSFLSQHPF